jgi:hypothetical protein
MPLTEMVVMVAIIAALFLGFINLVRLAVLMITHRTIRRLVESDPEKAEAMLARVGDRGDRSGDDRLSTILIAVGIAMIAASVVINDPAWIHYGVAAALFPLIVGTALWLRLFMLERASRRAARQ